MFFALAAMQMLPVNSNLAHFSHENADRVQVCHRCTAAAKETVRHVYECSQSRQELMRVHAGVEDAVRTAIPELRVNHVASLHTPPEYEHLSLAGLLFFFDPVLSREAQKGGVIPGVSESSSNADVLDLTETAQWDPLAGLLGVLPPHLDRVLALLFGLPDPRCDRKVGCSMRQLCEKLRLVLFKSALRIYKQRFKDEHEWWNTRATEEECTAQADQLRRWRLRRRIRGARSGSLKAMGATAVRGGKLPACAIGRQGTLAREESAVTSMRARRQRTVRGRRWDPGSDEEPASRRQRLADRDSAAPRYAMRSSTRPAHVLPPLRPVVAPAASDRNEVRRTLF